MNSLLFLLVVPGEPCSVGGWPRGRTHIIYPCFILPTCSGFLCPCHLLERSQEFQEHKSRHHLRLRFGYRLAQHHFCDLHQVAWDSPCSKERNWRRAWVPEAKFTGGHLTSLNFSLLSYSTISLAVSLIVCFKVHAESSYHLYWYHPDHLFACIITIGSSLTSLLPFFLQQLSTGTQNSKYTVIQNFHCTLLFSLSESWD